MIWQKTIARPVEVQGIGLHSGQPVKLTILPAAANQGVRFRRADLPGRPILRAHFSRVADTTRATTLKEGGATLSTVEHLLAALYGLGIDNALIEVHGAEIPILDGSARPFVEALLQAGALPLPWPRTYLVLRRTVEVKNGHGWMRAMPGQPRISYRIEFPHPLLSRQRFGIPLDAEHFRREIAPARTFGFLREVTFLQSRGLALGGSLDNAVILDEVGVLNPEGLRFPNECVRHKILDALGDLALLGFPLLGVVMVNRGGHELHHQFLTELMRREDAWHLWIPPLHNRTGRHPLASRPLWQDCPA